MAWARSSGLKSPAVVRIEVEKGSDLAFRKWNGTNWFYNFHDFRSFDLATGVLWRELPPQAAVILKCFILRFV